MVQILRSIHELRILRSDLRFRPWSHHGREYQILLPELSARTNLDATQRINRFKSNCGCHTAGILMSIALLALPVGFIFADHEVADVGKDELVLYCGYLLGFGLIGKLAGLLWVRMRMILLLGTIIRLAVNSRVSSESLVRSCFNS